MANTPYFGHGEQCYRWDNKCHCASSQPYQLPSESSAMAGTLYPGHEEQYYRWDNKCHSASRQPYQLPSESSAMAGTLYPGHEEQCYRWDNKCHCASSQPFLLPPEGSATPLSSPEPPLTVRMTPQQIRSQYSSLARDAQRQAGSSRGHEPAVTQPPGPPQGSDPPPPYESLYPPPYTREGERPPEYRPRR